MSDFIAGTVVAALFILVVVVLVGAAVAIPLAMVLWVLRAFGLV